MAIACFLRITFHLYIMKEPFACPNLEGKLDASSSRDSKNVMQYIKQALSL